jgi:hypothetical protein
MRAEAKRLINMKFFMSKTDVETYYPSVVVELLEQRFRSYGCHPALVSRLCKMLSYWTERGQLRGIPIGPEGFGVVGNAYLLPLDMRLAALEGIEYLRWMDDLYLFSVTEEAALAAIDAVDEELDHLGLNRSRDKTEHYSGRREALRTVHDDMLASLFDVMGLRKWWSADLLHERFERYVMEPELIEPRHFKAMIKAMMYRRDDYAASWLASHPAAMLIDPRLAADYFEVVGLDKPEISQRLFQLLASTKHEERDRSEGRDLHILRALSSKIWDGDEGQLFEKIALDETRRGPVRAWAIKAMARTPAWSPEIAMERSLEETNLYAARAFLLSLRRARKDRQVKTFLRHVRGLGNHLFTCALWVEHVQNPRP